MFIARQGVITRLGALPTRVNIFRACLIAEKVVIFLQVARLMNLFVRLFDVDTPRQTLLSQEQGIALRAFNKELVSDDLHALHQVNIFLERGWLLHIRVHSIYLTIDDVLSVIKEVSQGTRRVGY